MGGVDWQDHSVATCIYRKNHPVTIFSNADLGPTSLCNELLYSQIIDGVTGDEGVDLFTAEGV